MKVKRLVVDARTQKQHVDEIDFIPGQELQPGAQVNLKDVAALLAYARAQGWIS